MDEQTRNQITQVRMTAEQMGDAALDAISRGDIGLARTTARQAAQYARVALELETGERLVEQGDEDESAAPRTALSV